MENHRDETNNTDTPSIAPKKRLRRLPIVALAFAVAPFAFMLLMGIPVLGIVFAYIWMASVLGFYFHAVGLILGIIALITAFVERKKRVDLIGIALSVTAIIAAIIGFGVVMFFLERGP